MDSKIQRIYTKKWIKLLDKRLWKESKKMSIVYLSHLKKRDRFTEVEKTETGKEFRFFSGTISSYILMHYI